MQISSHPINTHEREIFMDILRGLAIFGILIANLTSGGLGWGTNNPETGPFLLPEPDEHLNFVYTILIEGKFYSIFSLLFGWGIALQVQRGINTGSDAIPLIRRRLMFMLLLGFIHLLIWPGDIVFFYAILGFLLLQFRRFSDKTLLIAGGGLILMPIFLYAAKMHWAWANTPAELMKAMESATYQYLIGIDSLGENFDSSAFITWINQSNWCGIFELNVGGIFWRFWYLFFVSRIPKVLGMFLIGYALGRSNFYKNIAQNKRTIYWIIGLGLVIGLPANFCLAYFEKNHGADYYNLGINGLYQTIAYAMGVAPLALAYVGILMLCFQKAIGKKIMSFTAPVGKMAFSNYMTHSVVCQFIFLPQGLNYGGSFGTIYLTIFGVSLYLLQIIVSTVWLKHFNFGPVEWLWRSLTYWKFQPMRKRPD